MFLPRLPRNSKLASLSEQSGQALIETAITLAMLTIMLIGAAEIGLIAYSSIEVTTAAKAAAQYGAQDHATAADTVGMQDAAALAAPTLSNLSTSVTHSCSCANGGASTCSVGDCTDSVIVETLNIQTSATFSPAIHLPGLPSTFKLQGQAIQKVLANE
jgi:Flp pilus assembly protein TadG